ncbi:MAG: exodeoxyribonuclease III, partial [Acidiferrobacterales bacterium]|nr:exodeoxyribonuclease III [Acidiferrobacterales bacterium]
MRVATWNINSIRARIDRLSSWLERTTPDVVCLQETKTADDQFPIDRIESAGYRVAIYGQKAYNGVAILSRIEPANVERGLGDGLDEGEARCIAATISSVRIVSAYVPLGTAVGTDKWIYK